MTIFLEHVIFLYFLIFLVIHVEENWRVSWEFRPMRGLAGSRDGETKNRDWFSQKRLTVVKLCPCCFFAVSKPFKRFVQASCSGLKVERSNRSWPKCAPKSRCQFLSRRTPLLKTSKNVSWEDKQPSVRYDAQSYAADPGVDATAMCQAQRNLPQKRMLGEEQPLESSEDRYGIDRELSMARESIIS